MNQTNTSFYQIEVNRTTKKKTKGLSKWTRGDTH